ncbi:rho GTPase-activating protein 32 [Monomorium pharaonis]|uniref:rho GTPase-activating protein 32 n=1 Tax=Monomorium pharaonis TaxID=307658 RepID=UPI0017472657|nr:rho GTPase-activating protein 32 [Monomorium pharaonis]XP_012534431.2 rho GTPase-activating protein 32 [Monomorium pharaonis]XP_012534432.2 rho GTPase-activating protein 32 [Monomorium pharaonis]XP_036147907.1 rho GTPase-activating protein 32 [Monomorium pharaonis]XP_036147908.1 rho GTPase-activating protein 32 [Monomorium pharaonis]
MPGPSTTQERPRAHRLTDIETQAKSSSGSRADDFDAPVSSGSNMSSIARFPKLDECAHFHYEHVELGTLEVSVNEDTNDSESYAVRITSGDACWTLQRSYDNFVMFDKQLHRCIFDRKFSSLTKLPDVRPKNACDILKDYLNRFSQLNHEGLNCGPVLNWLQLDNRGRRILVPESDSCPINTPAVAAAYAVRPYTAQAQDEISFQVGDMISVIDMPPPGESTWWRGKHGFAVGFFPAECVAVIGDKVPRHLTVSTTVRSKLPVKPVLRKHGKLIAFFRSFILNRPSRRRLKQSGILRERVFGCDLGEHLLNSGRDVPTVLTCCAEFIEKHGLVDGIYRLSGVTSNIQKLRNAFDEDRVPALHSDESILQDIHSVASLLKMYFRELPNPLCTYQLYSTFVNAVQANSDAERLRRMRDAVRKLPPPHYRTLEYLMRHLVRVAARGTETGMTPRNVAIVWAPNLLRCKELEVGGVAALQGVGVQAVVTEFLVCYAELIFGDGPVGRPKSLAITTSARLLTLEEARNRSLRGEPDYIEVGAGPAGLPLRYHTVIELPRKRNGSKRSPSLNWRALFGRGAVGKTRQIGTPPQTEAVPSSLNSLRRLRPVKSADSLDGEDGLGPLLGGGGGGNGPPPIRTCGHSRSVSHDSYFDHLADAPNASSPLDLSEIQLNFDLEEREMRMLSEEESGVASVEASPRRQRTEGNQCAAATGGSKRKRSRLEERLHCDVELRFIDSQSPDQVMVSTTNADIHSIDTPSPLQTPGYLPLLSEASTPLTPATLQGTSHSTTPVPANSPRISFRSFTLPLEIGDERDASGTNKEVSVSSSSEKSSDPGHRVSTNLEDRDRRIEPLCERIMTYDRHDRNATTSLPCTSENRLATKSTAVVSVFNDTEMTPCNRLSTSCEETASGGITVTSRKDVTSALTLHTVEIPSDSYEKKEKVAKECDESTDPLSSLTTAMGDLPRLPSNMTDLDSPMSCEQTLQELQESGFVICDDSDKVFSSMENPRATSSNNDSGDWVIVGGTAANSFTTSISESTSPNDSFVERNANPQASENVSGALLALPLTANTFRMGVDNSAGSRMSTRESEDMILDITDVTKKYASHEREEADDPQPSFGLVNEDNLMDDAQSRMRDRENGNRLSSCTTDVDSSQESNTREQQVRACYIEADNANVFGTNRNEVRDDKELFGETETFENYRRLSSRDTGTQQRDCATRTLHATNHPRFSNKPEEDQETNLTRDNDRDNDHCMNGLSKKCQSFGYNNSQKQQQQQSNTQPIRSKCASKRGDEGHNKCASLQVSQIRGNIEVRIPSENAAEPCEVAHAPEGASELMERTLDASNMTFTSVSSPTAVDDAAVLPPRDTAAILQELALQRLSGGVVGDMSTPVRRKYESETVRERRSFDSEIGREIVRESKMRQELDCARNKSDEQSQHLPPCLRARHARATRAALSRSLDEAKFNRMTGDISLSVKPTSEDAQHCSTPNVGSSSGICSSVSDKIQLRNLGGLDLGDPQCRERIEKYKEERRTFLRDKYRSESFRGVSSKTEDDSEQALLTRLKQRASRPSLH